MKVDSYRFLPRSFRSFYEGRGPFPGEEETVWAHFEKRLQASRIALLTSAGLYVKETQPSFDLERERAQPEWGDPGWRPIPSTATAANLGVAHLHINDEDVLADPGIALPARLLEQFAADGVIGSAAGSHISVMGYQERSLEGWRDKTADEVIAHLRSQGVDGLILAPV
ncbi:MAG: glycine/sarcosine/betaine reductase selenoprotein B family protein [Candidatus Dormiibacterota bacterium]